MVKGSGKKPDSAQLSNTEGKAKRWGGGNGTARVLGQEQWGLTLVGGRGVSSAPSLGVTPEGGESNAEREKV